MGLIGVIGVLSFAIETAEVTILFSSGPGRASLALHKKSVTVSNQNYVVRTFLNMGTKEQIGLRTNLIFYECIFNRV